RAVGVSEPPPAAPELQSTDPNDARGIYLADVTFDQAGTWQVDATVDMPGEGPQTLSASLAGATKHSLPPPGDGAQPTENLTMDSTGVPPAAIDSRALD